MKKRYFLFIVLCLLITAPGWGETVYIKNISDTVYFESGATSCDDVTVADTEGDLEAGLNASGANGVLNVCAGTYTDTEIDSDSILNSTHAGQVIQSATGVAADVTITETASTSPMIFALHNGFSLKNLTLTASGSIVIQIEASSNTISAGEISGCIISGGLVATYLYSRTASTPLSGYDIFSNTIGTTGAAASAIGILIRPGHASAAFAGTIHTVGIYNNNFSGISGRSIVVEPGNGVHLMADGWTAYGILIHDNVHTNTPHAAISLFGVSDNSGASPNRVYNETISVAGYGEGVSTNGIRLGATDGVKIYNNDISGTLSSGAGDGSGIVLDHWSVSLSTTFTGQWRFTNGSTAVTEIGAGDGSATTLLHRGAKVRLSDGTAWYTVASVTDDDNFVLTSNFLEDTHDDDLDATLATEWCEDTEIYSNRIHDNIDGEGYGIIALRTKNSVIKNNLIYGNRGGIQSNSLANEGLQLLNNTIYNSTAVHGILLNTNSPEVVIKNNIIDGVAGATFDGIHAVVTATTPDESNNLFYDINDADCTWGACINSVTGDPFFINPISGNFHLIESSTAIDKAANLGTAYEYDFYQNRQSGCGSAWDIGAIAFCEDKYLDYSIQDLIVPLINGPVRH